MRLIRAGDPKSKLYSNSICEALAPLEDLDQCEWNLLLSQAKYDNFDADNFLTEIFEAINFAGDEMTKNTSLGFGLQEAICQAVKAEAPYNECLQMLRQELSRLNQFFPGRSSIRGRQKRFLRRGAGAGRAGDGPGLGFRGGCTHTPHRRGDVLEHTERPRVSRQKDDVAAEFLGVASLTRNRMWKRDLGIHPRHGFRIGWKVAAIVDRPTMNGGQDSNQQCRDRVGSLTAEAGLRSSDYHCGHILANRFGNTFQIRTKQGVLCETSKRGSYASCNETFQG